MPTEPGSGAAAGEHEEECHVTAPFRLSIARVPIAALRPAAGASGVV
jgi:hypothetical protein